LLDDYNINNYLISACYATIIDSSGNFALKE